MKLNIKNHLTLTGLFQIEKFNADGVITYRGEEFSNTVLDSALVLLKSSTLNGLTSYVNLGASDAPVDVTQTGLQDRRYSTNTVFNGQNMVGFSMDPDFLYRKTVFQFNIGTCTGTHKEIGLSGGNGTNYYNRQLIKDANGNPTSITVAADEGLRITCEARMSHAGSSRSQRFRLNLKGATAGGITFAINGTTKTITLAEMQEKTPFVTYYGIPYFPYHQTTFLTKLDDITGTLRSIMEQTDGTYIINMGPWWDVAKNLTIQSHTLTGGTGDPELTEIVPFTPLPRGSFNHLNETTGQTITINYTFCHGEKSTVSAHPGVYGTYHIPGLGQANLWSSTVIHYFYIKLNDGTQGASQTSAWDAVIPFCMNRKASWAPGAMGTGTKTFNGINLELHDLCNEGNFGRIVFDQSISIMDTEEFEITFATSYGRV